MNLHNMRHCLSRYAIQNRVVIFLLLSLILFQSVTAKDSVVLVTGEIPPYCSEYLEGQGFITEVIAAVLREMDVEYDIHFYPWARCELMVSEGKAWAAFPYAYNEQRGEQFWFSETVGISMMKFFYYDETPLDSYEKLSDLAPYTIGGVLGYFYKKLFADANLSTKYTRTEVLSLKKVIAKRVDLVPLNEIVGWDLIREEFPKEIEKFGTLDKPLKRIELKLMVSKDVPTSENLLNQFNEKLAVFKTTEAYREILKRYNIPKSYYTQ